MIYSNSTELPHNLACIEQHWQHCNKGILNSSLGDIFYAYHIPKNPRYTVVLVNGRIESAHKYQELLWELAQNNIGVITYDHPGQGMSSRLVDNPQVGHIHSFCQFAKVLNLVVEQLVVPTTQNWLFMAHSMGGAIVCDYLSQYPESKAKGAFLCAPMLGINTSPYPFWIAHNLAKLACLLGRDKHYAIGQQDYQAKPFTENELTHCEYRYDLFRQLYEKHLQLQLGGVSFGWLNAALSLTKKLSKEIIKHPLSIASANQDTIVKASTHHEFAQRQPHCALKTYQGKHELLCESDPIRNAVLSQFYAFAESVTLNETGS
ncbi:alpha/beta fold hydrolase [Pseudoalteromonas luteoviolacea]|uniref:alpha/beta fold hydrolase n=1 Tax=Pseudoalteromonas luteoviolacea TaxID=43657 RepID=UPI001B39C3B6|nr:alpha/beta fold hydrolase [Pseudoalteromonas luteoviolacea]MBQ4814152.1 alpha/beta fold hydrolase [Pseudoalteromonas luteoviolacea]